MRTGYLIVGGILVAFSALWFVTIILWPVGVFFLALAAILFILALRPEPIAAIMPVAVPSYPQVWHHPYGTLPPPPPSPIPIVVNIQPPPIPFSMPSLMGPPPTRSVQCRRCGAVPPPGSVHCTNCGSPL